MWKHRDPIERVKSLLVREYQVKSDKFDEVAAEAETSRCSCATTCSQWIGPTPMRMFDHAYAEPHPLIEEGRREMIELGVSGGAH